MRTLGVCGGNGVILHKFKDNLIGNIEPRSVFHSKNLEQWESNFNGIKFYRKLPERDFKDVDIIIGAPDCGHSSILALSRAKKLGNPKENKSLDLYLKSVLKYNPKLFMMENLPKLLEQYTKEDLKAVLPDYRLIFHTLSVSEFGNSQENRVRLVLIGINRNWPESKQRLRYIRDHFSYIYGVNSIKTSGELLAGLEQESIENGNIREDINDKITLYAGFKCYLYEVRDHWLSEPNKKRYSVVGRNFTTAPGVYRNLSSEPPATARKANRQFNHNGLQLTPRELARIQGVPDDFNIYIDPKNPKYWINKGRATVTKCPPYEIGQWFYERVISLTEKI